MPRLVISRIVHMAKSTQVEKDRQGGLMKSLKIDETLHSRLKVECAKNQQPICDLIHTIVLEWVTESEKRTPALKRTRQTIAKVSVRQ